MGKDLVRLHCKPLCLLSSVPVHDKQDRARTRGPWQQAAQEWQTTSKIGPNHHKV